MFAFKCIMKKLSTFIFRYLFVLCCLSLIFVQAGGLPLLPVSVEITYGLERILMLLQVSVSRYILPHSSLYVSAETSPSLFAGSWSFQENWVCWWDHIWRIVFREWVNNSPHLTFLQQILCLVFQSLIRLQSYIVFLSIVHLITFPTPFCWSHKS